MRSWRAILCAFLLWPAVLSPQATTNEIYVYAAVPGQAAYKIQTVRLDTPLTLTADASGVLHLGVAPVITGNGLISITGGLAPQQIALNTAAVAFRVDPPAGPGPCIYPLSGAALGSASWAAEGSYLYVCVPNGAGVDVWARAPLAVSW